jgi:hypothetical protein
LRADRKQLLEDYEKYDDAASEIMMMTDDKFMVLMGEAFVECDEDFANDYCEKKKEVKFEY